MIVDEGLNKTRDLVSSGLSSGENGSDGTLPTISDTDCISPIADTELTLTSKTSTDKMITVQHDIDSTTANGNTFKEYVTHFSTDEILHRTVHTLIDKNNTLELAFITSFIFESGE